MITLCKYKSTQTTNNNLFVLVCTYNFWICMYKTLKTDPEMIPTFNVSLCIAEVSHLMLKMFMTKIHV